MTEIMVKVKLLLINSKNEVILGYSHNEYQFPGGTQEPNEELIATINREIKEELGLIVDPTKLVLFKTEKTEDDFADFYYLKEDYNIEDIIIQEDEVQAVKWVNREEIKKMIENKVFLSSHAIFFNYCVEFLNQHY